MRVRLGLYGFRVPKLNTSQLRVWVQGVGHKPLTNPEERLGEAAEDRREDLNYLVLYGNGGFPKLGVPFWGSQAL